MGFRLLWLSCSILAKPFVSASPMLAAAPKWIAVQGDTPYVGPWGTRYGHTTVAIYPEISADEMHEKHLQHWGQWGWSRLQAERRAGRFRILYQPDDHEWAGDNWDHTLARANSDGGLHATTQAEVNQHWTAGLEAVLRTLQSHCDNPPPGLAGNGNRPAAALAEGNDPPASNYPVRYFHLDLDVDGAQGGSHTRLVSVDGISYRSSNLAPVAQRTMLGAVQAQWLIDTVLQAHAAGFAHIVVLSNKKLFAASTNDNRDTFGEFTVERDRILAAFAAAGARPLWLSGDRHTPHAMEDRRSTAQILDVCACPVSTRLNGVGFDPRIVWIGYRQTYGQLDVEADRARLSLRDAGTGGALWSAQVAARDNTPVYERSTVSPA